MITIPGIQKKKRARNSLMEHDLYLEVAHITSHVALEKT